MSSSEEKNTARHQFKQPFLSLSPEDATDKPVDTEIVGQIPEWLEGSLYRNGPGIFQVGETRLKHLFDGFSVLHKFHIHKGKATYMSRVLDTETWQNSVKAKRLIATQFGTYETPDPCKSTFAKLSTIFKPQHKAEWTDNVSVNIVEHGDRLYAMTETPTIVRVDPAELKAAGRENVAKTIAVHMSTAHPHFDEQGNMYNLGTAFNPPNNYNIIRIPPPSKEDKDAPVTTQAELVTSLKSRWMFSMGYNHSFGMSRDHFVILEQPITMSSFGFLTNNWRSAAAYDNFVKRPSEELIFRLVSRQNNAETAIKYRAEPTFTFHFVNCYEDDEHKALVVDFCGYSDLNIIDNLYLDNLDKEGIAHSVPTFRRYVLPLSIRGAAVGTNLVTLPNSGATATLRPDGTVFLEADYITNGTVHMELPKINYDRNTKKHRYVYGTTLFSKEPKLMKLDLETKQVLEWQEQGYQAGEPVFVPRPGGSGGEDDGIILSPVLSIKGNEGCFLLVLDAKTFKEIARAKTPDSVKMSLSFHGSYVQSKQ